MSAAVESHDHAHAEGDHGHLPFQAHHFETMQQQFDSGKLGIWLFLTTEILMFSGLFCAYLVYRANHPEIFLYAHEYLDTTLGAINTVVLLVSSLTMAWAVRAAQLNQQKILIGMLTATLICAGAFMVIKYFEYTAKFDHGLYPGRSNILYQEQLGPVAGVSSPSAVTDAAEAAEASPDSPTPYGADETDGADEHGEGGSSEHSGPTGPPPSEAHALDSVDGSHPAGEHGDHHSKGDSHDHYGPEGPAPRDTHVFFGIYYMMTGLHGIHIVAGMIAISWLLYRSVKGHFNSEYFGPVDYVGLYWHLVDLIWIYLFPLLYLIRS